MNDWLTDHIVCSLSANQSQLQVANVGQKQTSQDGESNCSISHNQVLTCQGKTCRWSQVLIITSCTLILHRPYQASSYFLVCVFVAFRSSRRLFNICFAFRLKPFHKTPPRFRWTLIIKASNVYWVLNTPCWNSMPLMGGVHPRCIQG